MTTSVDAADNPLVGPAFDYDAFISYRRADGGWHARTLRHRLRDVHVPRELTTNDAPARRLRVYLDQIYERATDDFFEHTIKPALRASRHLVVVQSASATEALPGGGANWLAREIDYFRSLSPDGRSISVAVTMGELTAPLPARLDETHPNIERLDLRGWRRYRRASLDEGLLSLAATLHDITPADMPTLRREDERRRTTQRRRVAVGASIVALALAIAGAVALWQYGEARLATERRNIAMASSLWDRLDFADLNTLTDDELNALWEIAAGDATVRAEFLDQLSRDSLRAARLGRGRDPILRAVFFRWPTDRADALYRTVLDGVSDSLRSERLAGVALALEGLARTLTPQQADALMDPVTKRLVGVEDSEDNLIEALGTALQALAAQVTAEQAYERFPSIITTMRETGLGARSGRLAWTGQVLARRLNATGAQALFPSLLADLSADDDAADDLRPFLALVVTGMADKLSADQARVAFAPVVGSMATADSETMPAFVQLARVLAAHVSSAQARSATAAVVNALKRMDAYWDGSNRLLTSITGQPTTNDGGPLFKEMQLTLLTLASRLTTRDAATALRPLLATMLATTDPEILDTVDVGAAAIADHISPDEALARFIEVANAVKSASDPNQLASLSLAAVRLADRIDSDHAWVQLSWIVLDLGTQATSRSVMLAPAAQKFADKQMPKDIDDLLSSVLIQVRTTANADNLWALGVTGKSLGPRLPASDARRVATELLAEAQRPGDPARVSALVSVLHGVQVHVTAEEAEALLPMLLAACVKSYDTKQVTELAGAAEAMAGRLSAAAAERQFPAVLQILENPGTTIGQLEAIAGVVNAFVGRVEPSHLRRAVRPLFRVLGATRTTDHVTTLKRVVDASGGLSRDDYAHLHAQIAWAPDPVLSALWAEALVQLAPRAPVQEYVMNLISELKSPSTAAAATTVLLDGLQSAVPEAPGAPAGLPANLSWISTKYPAIDLNRAPVCPPPLREGLACPASPVN